jgi:ureidoacrylate peracid hydrolase
MEVLTTLDMKIAPTHTAVVVVDMQNDFCELVALLDAARRVRAKIILVQMSTSDDDLTGPILDRLNRISADSRTCPQGIWGAELIPEIKAAPGDIIVYKTRYSAFIKNGLDKKLKDIGVKTLIMTGVATNICVESTARDGYMLDYYIVVPQDLVACAHQELQDTSMKNLGSYFATITSSEEIQKAWGNSD